MFEMRKQATLFSGVTVDPTEVTAKPEGGVCLGAPGTSRGWHGWSRDSKERAVVGDAGEIRAARTGRPLLAIVKTLALTLSKTGSQEGVQSKRMT